MGQLSDFFQTFDFSVLRLPTIGFNTAIEILIMTYVVYKFVKWVQRTTAWALFRGIFLIFLVSVLSYFLRLHTLSWIISNTFSVGIIALIVIFQPELRSALERIGKNQLARLVVPQSNTGDALSPDSAEAVIKAALDMSAEKTGAFIVIERTVSLGEYESTGVRLDADITSQLLENIFVDKTPLHDGAVIIRGNKIVSASCIMTLTKKEIGAEYGTRHRAAVGTSEVTDADIIVVSEETGKISFAKEGELYKNLGRTDLEKILLNNQSPSKRKGLWKGWGYHEKINRDIHKGPYS